MGGSCSRPQSVRLETAAEIRRMSRDWCDRLGRTSMPEAVLARELELPYATLAVVANAAAGIGGSRQSISMPEIRATLDEAMARVCGILRAWLEGRR